jgi:ferritin-like metal-binding protein YciE
VVETRRSRCNYKGEKTRSILRGRLRDVAARGDKWAADAGLIGASAAVEHYEIAPYDTVRAFAEVLGKDEDAGLLQQTLDEEGETKQTFDRTRRRMC